jgi:glycosyltransferase involved in cell wall biosynthesis
VKVSVLCFDVSDNAAGRAHLLAQLLAPIAEVEIVGPRHGAGVWPPVAADGVRYVSVPAGRIASFAGALPGLLRAADGDLLYASKPRLGSAGLGLLKRRLGGRPLLLDIDDWEVGFFLRGGVWGTVGRAVNWTNPRGLPWTWLMERAARTADAITVASRFLQERFGGTLIPHVRDTDAWRPGLDDPTKVRAQLDATGKRLVMFLGTAREHKGVDDLVAAVAALARPDLVLALVGTDPDGATGRRLRARLPALRLMPTIAFSEVPRYLEAADVVAVPQREGPDTRGQVPAKLFDAMALARPIVATRVSMIPEILDGGGCGVLVPPGDAAALGAAIERLASDPEKARELGTHARARCIARYSYASARRDLFPLVQGLLARTGRG